MARFIPTLIDLLVVVTLFLVFIPTRIAGATGLLAFVLLAAYDWKFLKQSFLLVSRPLVGLFVALTLLSLFSEMPNKSFKGIYDMLRAALFMFPLAYAVHFKSKSLIFISLLGLVIAVVVFGGGALYLFYEYPNFQLQNMTDQLDWDFSQNVLATQFSIYVLAGLLLFQITSNKLVKLSSAFVAVCFLFMIVALGSRGTLAAIYIALTVGFLFARQWFWFGAMLSFAGAVGFVIMLSVGGAVYQGLFVFFKVGNVANGRLPIYDYVIDTVSQNWLFGHGINTYKHIAQSIYTHPHSIYMDILFSLGVAGSLIIFVCFGSIFRRISCSWSASQREVFCSAGSVLLVYSLVRGGVDFKFFSFEFLVFIFAAFGLMLGEKLCFRSFNCKGTNTSNLSRVLMVNCFVASSPLQIFNCIEARNRFHKGESNRLIVIYRKKIDLKQMKVLLDERWHETIFFKFSPFNRLFYPVIVWLWVKSWGKIEHLYLGYLPNIRAHLVHTLMAKKVTLVDDGHVTVNLADKISKGVLQHSVKTKWTDKVLRRRITLEFVDHLNIFSVYRLPSYPASQYLYNDYRAFRKKSAKLNRSDRVVFIGTDLIGNVISSEQEFESLLHQVRKHYRGRSITYSAHRYEDLDWLKSIGLPLGFDVVRYDSLIENQIMVEGVIPAEIATFMSSGVDTLVTLYPVKASVFVVPERMILPDKVVDCRKVYTSYKDRKINKFILN